MLLFFHFQNFDNVTNTSCKQYFLLTLGSITPPDLPEQQQKYILE